MLPELFYRPAFGCISCISSCITRSEFGNLQDKIRIHFIIELHRWHNG